MMILSFLIFFVFTAKAAFPGIYRSIFIFIFPNQSLNQIGEQFRVTSLPGLNKMPSYGVYSGYVTVR